MRAADLTLVGSPAGLGSEVVFGSSVGSGSGEGSLRASAVPEEEEDGLGDLPTSPTSPPPPVDVDRRLKVPGGGGRRCSVQVNTEGDVVVEKSHLKRQGSGVVRDVELSCSPLSLPPPYLAFSSLMFRHVRDSLDGACYWPADLT